MNNRNKQMRLSVPFHFLVQLERERERWREGASKSKADKGRTISTGAQLKQTNCSLMSIMLSGPVLVFC